MSVLHKKITVTFSNGERWEVPIMAAIRSKERDVALEFYDGNLKKASEYISAFAENLNEEDFIEWVKQKLSWSDLVCHAKNITEIRYYDKYKHFRTSDIEIGE